MGGWWWVLVCIGALALYTVALLFISYDVGDDDEAND
jgi:hypothetical protein